MAGIRVNGAAVVLTLLLSSCSLFKANPRENLAFRVPDQPSLEVYAAEQMAIGRKMLDEGNYGQAVVAFRNVQHMADYAAAAHNGLGIAYSQLGRPDISERYFKLALTEAPGDRRFQANLQKFYETTQALARADRKDIVALDEEKPAPPFRIVSAPGSPVLRIEQPTARIVSVASNEVRIETAPIETRRRVPRGQTVLAAATNAGRTQSASYPVRVQLNMKSTPNIAYPVRIQMAAGQ